ncbi:hypothetical protein ZWY2020_042091 [Hordeum vulgare]|nr:hypothetical protein ZWY2020_042091 [Hordeum vulgare]
MTVMLHLTVKQSSLRFEEVALYVGPLDEVVAAPVGARELAHLAAGPSEPRHRVAVVVEHVERDHGLFYFFEPVCSSPWHHLFRPAVGVHGPSRHHAAAAGRLSSAAKTLPGHRTRSVVRASTKDIAFGQASHSVVQADVEKLAAAVGVTLGPRVGNVQGKSVCVDAK